MFNEKALPLTNASSILDEASATLIARGEMRDTPGGERSMKRTVTIFQALSGVTLTTYQGWLFMIALKFARMRTGFNLDDYVDALGYTALAYEEKAEETFQLLPEPTK